MSDLPRVFGGVQLACAREDGFVTLHVSNANGVASSLSRFVAKTDGNLGHIQTLKSVQVPSVHLDRFFEKIGVVQIDDYVSDIQEYDFEVLKTIAHFIEQERVRKIQIECTWSADTSLYEGAPACDFQSIRAFLELRYELVAQGAGELKPNQFDDVTRMPSFDTMWLHRKA